MRATLRQFMTIHTLEQEQRFPISLEAAWEFFSTPRDLVHYGLGSGMRASRLSVLE